MENLKDQLSHEELALVTGGTSSTGILSSNNNSNNMSYASNCTGGTCKNSCTPGCSAGCSPGCVKADGKDGYQ